MRTLAATLVLPVVLAGCLAPPLPPPPPGPDVAEMRLIETATRAEAALTRLAAIQAAESPAQETPLPRIVPPDLLRRVSIVWIGPFAELAERLATEAGFKFTESGPRPLLPVMVEIRAQDEPLIAVFRDAGLQAGEAGTLKVDPTRSMVHIDWSPRSRG